MEDNLGLWLFQFLGRLHPMTVHFPIGLLVVALFMEILTISGRRQAIKAGIHWMVYLGALFAIISAFLGWLLRTHDDYTGSLVLDHQNAGIATAVFSGITALLLRRSLIKKVSNALPYRIGLIVTVVLLTITGHLGSNITHGEDFLTSVLPANRMATDDGNSLALLAQFRGLDTLSETQQDELNLGVRAIFAHNCYQCHTENKRKGELVLDNKRGVFAGGESGPIIVPGQPGQSELYKRISLSPDHEDVMPKKGKVLQDGEIALIRLWIEKGAHWSDRPLKVFPEAELALSKPSLPTESREGHPLDKFIDIYFRKNEMPWPVPVDDRTFIRRAYLDIVGLLPEPEAIAQFENDGDTEKREHLIDTLLADDHNYTQHWLSFWNDLLRNDYSGPGFITGGRKEITDWLYLSLQSNKPYDRMIGELVNPTEASEGFIKGIQWRGVVNSSQRTEMQAAQNIGQSLMGINVKCASCHNSFVSNLTLEQSYGFASIFADSLLELNRCDQPLGKMAEVNFLYPELGSVNAATVKERLSRLAEAMIKPANGRLYRTITNRIWKRLMGRGLVEPVDEMDHAPWDAAVLDWLAADFIDSGYDLKHLIKRVMTSKAYQLPSVHYADLSEIKTDYVFKGPMLRRLSAEQFSDAVSQCIAPMYYAVAYDPLHEGLNTDRIWHRELRFDRDVLPEPGRRYFRGIITLPNKPIAMAKVLISVDHSYSLYLNGKPISKGDDWRKVAKIALGSSLLKGQNLFAIAGFNEGSIANPAGILFALKVRYDDGTEAIFSADNHWKSSAEVPTGEWTTLGFNDEKWEKVRNYGSGQWDRPVNYTFVGQGQVFARASLVKQHPFLKAMGRPSRENVATSREDQATLLQALELTNGDYFNSVLEEGAEIWSTRYGKDTEKIVTALYQSALGRRPTAKEGDIMLKALGTAPDKEALQDLFWSTLNLPEFQFIY